MARTFTSFNANFFNRIPNVAFFTNAARGADFWCILGWIVHILKKIKNWACFFLVSKNLNFFNLAGNWNLRLAHGKFLIFQFATFFFKMNGFVKRFDLILTGTHASPLRIFASTKNLKKIMFFKNSKHGLESLKIKPTKTPGLLYYP